MWKLKNESEIKEIKYQKNREALRNGFIAFFAFFIFFVLLHKYVGTKSSRFSHAPSPTLSWAEIYYNIYYYYLGGFIIGVLVYIFSIFSRFTNYVCEVCGEPKKKNKKFCECGGKYVPDEYINRPD